MWGRIITKLKRFFTPKFKSQLKDLSSGSSKLSLWQTFKSNRAAKIQAKLKEEENICKNVIEKIFDQDKSRDITQKDANLKLNTNRAETEKNNKTPFEPQVVQASAKVKTDLGTPVIPKIDKNPLDVKIISNEKAEEKSSATETSKIEVNLSDKANAAEKISGSSTGPSQTSDKPVKVQMVGQDKSGEKANSSSKETPNVDKTSIKLGVVSDKTVSEKVICNLTNFEDKNTTPKIQSFKNTNQIERDILLQENKEKDKDTVYKEFQAKLKTPLVIKANENVVNKLELETDCAYPPPSQVDSILKAFGVSSKEKQEANEPVQKDDSAKDMNITKDNSSILNSQDTSDNKTPVIEGIRASRENFLKKMAFDNNTLTAVETQDAKKTPEKVQFPSAYNENENQKLDLKETTKGNILQSQTDKLEDALDKKTAMGMMMRNQVLDDIVASSSTLKEKMMKSHLTKTIPDMQKSIPKMNALKPDEVDIIEDIENTNAKIDTANKKPLNMARLTSETLAAQQTKTRMSRTFPSIKKSKSALDQNVRDVIEETECFSTENDRRKPRLNTRRTITEMHTAEYEHCYPKEQTAAKMIPTKPDVSVRNSLRKLCVSEYEDPNNPIHSMVSTKDPCHEDTNTEEDKPCDSCHSLPCPCPPGKRMCPQSDGPEIHPRQNTNCPPGPMSAKPHAVPPLRCPKNFSYPECPSHPSWNYGCRCGRLCPFCMRYGLCKWPACSMYWPERNVASRRVAHSNVEKTEFDSNQTDCEKSSEKAEDSTTYKCEGESDEYPRGGSFNSGANSSKTCGIVSPFQLGVNRKFLKTSLLDFLPKHFSMHEVLAKFFMGNDASPRNALIKGKKTFEPWSPVPSWTSKKPKPKRPECPPGCRLMPLPKLKEVEGNPCELLPKPYGHAHHFGVVMRIKTNEDFVNYKKNL